MPWKLIVGILIGLLLLTFIGLNWQHTTAISFGFYVFQDVPAVIAILGAFMTGLIISIPFAVATGRKQAQKMKSKHQKLQEKAITHADSNVASSRGSKKSSRSPKMKQNASEQSNAESGNARTSTT